MSTIPFINRWRFVIVDSCWEIVGVGPVRIHRIDGCDYAADDPIFQLWGPYVPMPQVVNPTKSEELSGKEKRHEDPRIGVRTASENEPGVADASVQRSPYILECFEYVEPRRSNDCPVVTAANCFGLTYDEAKNVCFHHGWSSMSGMPAGMMTRVAEYLGFDATPRPDLLHGSVDGFHADGVFFVSCEGHIMPSINGKLYNVGQMGHREILDVYEVHPKQDKDEDNDNDN